MLYRVLGNLSAFRSHFKLVKLNLKHCNKITGTLEPLSSCSQLEHLNIRECWWLEGTCDPLLQCPNLQSLNVQGCAKLEEIQTFAEKQERINVTFDIPKEISFNRYASM